MLNHDDTMFADALRRAEGGEVKGYRIESLLGRGALTSVYVAGRGGSRFALKAIPLEGPTRALAELALSEAERFKKLRHEHLVSVYEIFSFGAATWVAGDLAPGRSADHFADGVLGWESTAQTALRATKALAYAWRFHGLAHGNLKPSNLIIDMRGGVITGLRISDLGLERVGGLSASDVVLGAPLYLAPELADGRPADDRADQYALGAVLHFLLSGHAPDGGVARLEKVPQALIEVITTLLRPDPAQRFTGWDEVSTALEGCLSDNPFEPPATARITRDPQVRTPLSTAIRRSGTGSIAATDDVGSWLMEQARETVRHARGAALAPSLANGERVAGVYTVTSCLRTSSLIEHYVVDEAILDRKLVLKILTPAGMANPLLLQRMIAEGSLLGALHHPSFPFAAGRGSWQHNGSKREYVAVERITGADLKTYLTHKGRFAEGQALWVVHELATAMEHAFDACRLVHRDLKPAHLAVADGEPRRLVITDFATALFLRPRDLQDFSTAERSLIDDAGAGKAVGTPAYLSPEQVRGEAPIPQMDMYALGCVLFQLLTGEPPFKAPNAVMLMQSHLEVAPPDITQLAEVTPSTADLIARCLAKNARDRFATWKQLRQAVHSASFASQAAKRRKDRGQTATYTRSIRPGSGEHGPR